jgi:hypothetical protein
MNSAGSFDPLPFPIVPVYAVDEGNDAEEDEMTDEDLQMKEVDGHVDDEGDEGMEWIPGLGRWDDSMHLWIPRGMTKPEARGYAKIQHLLPHTAIPPGRFDNDYDEDDFKEHMAEAASDFWKKLKRRTKNTSRGKKGTWRRYKGSHGSEHESEVSAAASFQDEYEDEMAKAAGNFWKMMARRKQNTARGRRGTWKRYYNRNGSVRMYNKDGTTVRADGEFDHGEFYDEDFPEDTYESLRETDSWHDHPWFRKEREANEERAYKDGEITSEELQDAKDNEIWMAEIDTKYKAARAAMKAAGNPEQSYEKFMSMAASDFWKKLDRRKKNTSRGKRGTWKRYHGPYGSEHVSEVSEVASGVSSAGNYSLRMSDYNQHMEAASNFWKKMQRRTQNTRRGRKGTWRRYYGPNGSEHESAVSASGSFFSNNPSSAGRMKKKVKHGKVKHHIDKFAIYDLPEEIQIKQTDAPIEVILESLPPTKEAAKIKTIWESMSPAIQTSLKVVGGAAALASLAKLAYEMSQSQYLRYKTGFGKLNAKTRAGIQVNNLMDGAEAGRQKVVSLAGRTGQAISRGFGAVKNYSNERAARALTDWYQNRGVPRPVIYTAANFGKKGVKKKTKTMDTKSKKKKHTIEVPDLTFSVPSRPTVDIPLEPVEITKTEAIVPDQALPDPSMTQKLKAKWNSLSPSAQTAIKVGGGIAALAAMAGLTYKGSQTKLGRSARRKFSRFVRPTRSHGIKMPPVVGRAGEVSPSARRGLTQSPVVLRGVPRYDGGPTETYEPEGEEVEMSDFQSRPNSPSPFVEDDEEETLVGHDAEPGGDFASMSRETTRSRPRGLGIVVPEGVGSDTELTPRSSGVGSRIRKQADDLLRASKTGFSYPTSKSVRRIHRRGDRIDLGNPDHLLRAQMPADLSAEVSAMERPFYIPDPNLFANLTSVAPTLGAGGKTMPKYRPLPPPPGYTSAGRFDTSPEQRHYTRQRIDPPPMVRLNRDDPFEEMLLQNAVNNSEMSMQASGIFDFIPGVKQAEAMAMNMARPNMRVMRAGAKWDAIKRFGSNIRRAGSSAMNRMFGRNKPTSQPYKGQYGGTVHTMSKEDIDHGNTIKRNIVEQDRINRAKDEATNARYHKASKAGHVMGAGDDYNAMPQWRIDDDNKHRAARGLPPISPRADGLWSKTKRFFGGGSKPGTAVPMMGIPMGEPMKFGYQQPQQQKHNSGSSHSQYDMHQFGQMMQQDRHSKRRQSTNSCTNSKRGKTTNC